jgi:hypothetical protein
MHACMPCRRSCCASVLTAEEGGEGAR